MKVFTKIKGFFQSSMKTVYAFLAVNVVAFQSSALAAGFESEDSKFSGAIEKIVKIVAGLGGGGLTLAVLIITLMIIFGSISPSKKGTYWMALVSCLLGAFVFFMAFSFADEIQRLVNGL